ncbi:MAG: hypothetical protein ACRD6B_20760 [Bryobacteraceae bacterium]
MQLVDKKQIISEMMSEWGRKGGKLSGKARMKKLTPAQRSAIAKKAAAASAKVRAKKAAGKRSG